MAASSRSATVALTVIAFILAMPAVLSARPAAVDASAPVSRVTTAVLQLPENAPPQTGSGRGQMIDKATRERQYQAALVVARQPNADRQLEQAIAEHYKDQFLISSDY